MLLLRDLVVTLIGTIPMSHDHRRVQWMRLRQPKITRRRWPNMPNACSTSSKPTASSVASLWQTGRVGTRYTQIQDGLRRILHTISSSHQLLLTSQTRHTFSPLCTHPPHGHNTSADMQCTNERCRAINMRYRTSQHIGEIFGCPKGHFGLPLATTVAHAYVTRQNYTHADASDRLALLLQDSTRQSCSSGRPLREQGGALS